MFVAAALLLLPTLAAPVSAAYCYSSNCTEVVTCYYGCCGNDRCSASCCDYTPRVVGFSILGLLFFLALVFCICYLVVRLVKNKKRRNVAPATTTTTHTVTVVQHVPLGYQPQRNSYNNYKRGHTSGKKGVVSRSAVPGPSYPNNVPAGCPPQSMGGQHPGPSGYDPPPAYPAQPSTSQAYIMPVPGGSNNLSPSYPQKPAASHPSKFTANHTHMSDPSYPTHPAASRQFGMVSDHPPPYSSKGLPAPEKY